MDLLTGPTLEPEYWAERAADTGRRQLGPGLARVGGSWRVMAPPDGPGSPANQQGPCVRGLRVTEARRLHLRSRPRLAGAVVLEFHDQ
jgi:hypothetical protein